jgi:single-stranded-DNA-specific exonuclease
MNDVIYCIIDHLEWFILVSSSSQSDNLSRTGRSWIFPEIQEKDVLYLQQKYKISAMAARLTAHRIRSTDEGDEIFFALIKNHLPDPMHLPDIEKALDHTHSCLQKKKPLAVWGDYDVDGACAAALLVRYFRRLGMSIVPYVPDRFQEGYGPNAKGLLSFNDQGIKDVFIVDCGTTAFEPLKMAKSNGMNVIVIDHHRVGINHPEALAFVNPKRKDYAGPLQIQELCAGGLVFLFLVGLSRYLREKNFFSDVEEPDLFSFLDLVALSTICDMMPLRHINRAFVKQGLKVMRARKNIGLASLLDTSGIQEAPNPIHMGYVVGPRINAGGRIGDSSLGVRLLSCENKADALNLAQELTQLNQERQIIERKISKEALSKAIAQKDHAYLFVWGEDWHEGVLGIIASYLKETFYKPTFVLTAKGDYLKGSARSVPGIDIGELVHIACEKKLLTFGGGHPMAGGLTLERIQLDPFLSFIDEFFSHNKVEETQPSLTIDMPITLDQLNSPDFFEIIELLGPFGANYAQPKFLVSHVRLEHMIIFGYNHLKMYGTQFNGRKRHSIICFRQADKPIGKWLLSQPSHIADCVFTVQIDNKWGYKKALLILEDIK